jgi:hypothetical protein
MCLDVSAAHAAEQSSPGITLAQESEISVSAIGPPSAHDLKSQEAALSQCVFGARAVARRHREKVKPNLRQWDRIILK